MYELGLFMGGFLYSLDKSKGGNDKRESDITEVEESKENSGTVYTLSSRP